MILIQILMYEEFTLRAIVMLAVVSTIVGIGLTPMQSFSASSDGEEQLSRKCPCPKAPIATSDNNLYITWWSNKTGNDEVMFKASTDRGMTFGNKMNLSNSTNAESQDAEIAASGNDVYVTWWERNSTNEEPVLRISNDNGKTFGEEIMLSEK
jgi:hypothetical protein